MWKILPVITSVVYSYGLRWVCSWLTKYGVPEDTSEKKESHHSHDINLLNFWEKDSENAEFVKGCKICV